MEFFLLGRFELHGEICDASYVQDVYGKKLFAKVSANGVIFIFNSSHLPTKVWEVALTPI